MNLRHLQIFITVAEIGNMSKTSRQLHMTQPAVSQAISELEEELGVKLFERMNKKVVLNYPGEIMYKYSKNAITMLEEAKSAIRDITNARIGKLNIGASTTIGIYLLPHIIGKFKEYNPDIDIHFNIDNTRVIEEMVLSHQIDIGLVEGFHHSDQISAKHFLDDELYLVCSNHHHWAGKDSLSIEIDELYREPLIFREEGSGTREVIEKEFARHNFVYRPIHVLNNTEAIKNAVKANIGIAILSRIAVIDDINKGSLVKIDIRNVSFGRRFNIIYHKDKYQSPLFNAFCNHLTVYKNKSSI